MSTGPTNPSPGASTKQVSITDLLMPIDKFEAFSAEVWMLAHRFQAEHKVSDANIALALSFIAGEKMGAAGFLLRTAEPVEIQLPTLVAGYEAGHAQQVEAIKRRHAQRQAANEPRRIITGEL